jgi:hypothetical protein
MLINRSQSVVAGACFEATKTNVVCFSMRLTREPLAGLRSTEIDPRARLKNQPDQVACIDLIVKAGGDVNAQDNRG